MPRSGRRNVAVECAFCRGKLWARRRADIDLEGPYAGPLARLLVGCRSRESDSEPRAKFDLEYPLLKDLPRDLAEWVRQRARAAVLSWIELGVISRDELRELSGSFATAPTLVREDPVRVADAPDPPRPDWSKVRDIFINRPLHQSPPVIVEHPNVREETLTF